MNFSATVKRYFSRPRFSLTGIRNRREIYNRNWRRMRGKVKYSKGQKKVRYTRRLKRGLRRWNERWIHFRS